MRLIDTDCLTHDSTEPNVYEVRIPIVTEVTMRVIAHDWDDIEGEAVAAWKRGDDPIATGAPCVGWSEVVVQLVEDNAPSEPEWDDDEPSAA